MKKIILTSLLIITMVTLVTSIIYFDNFQDARDYIRGIKQNRTDAINDARETIELTSDKLCTVDFETEEISCYVDYQFIHNNETIVGRAILEFDSTPLEDKQKIKEDVKDRIYAMYSPDEIAIKIRDYEGVTFGR